MGKSMKVIFLDIDGVLNSMNYMQYLHVSDKETRDAHGQLFDKMCVYWLYYIIEKTKAKIVISSTWRHSGLSVMLDLWLNRGLPGEIIDITPSSRDSVRGPEIEAWLNENDVESYVILDDDSDMLDHQIKNFVKTNSQMGLTLNDASKAISILNK